MKQFQLFALFVMLAALFSTALCCMSSRAKEVAAPAKPAPTTVNPLDYDEDLNSSEFSGHECGPVHGKCPYSQCCSLRNECGNSTSHCNVSLGCKKKWGICH